MSDKTKRVCKYLNIAYLITGVLSLLVFILLLPDIQLVATDSFDDAKWLDVDIFIINRIFIPLFFATIIMIVIQFIVKILNKNTYK